MKILETRKYARGNTTKSRSISNRLSPMMTDNSRSNSRKKQRDYTIPVRLNQQLLSCSPGNKFIEANVDMFSLEEQQRDRLYKTKSRLHKDVQVNLGNTRYIQYLFDKYQRHVMPEVLIKMPASTINANNNHHNVTLSNRVRQTNQISIKLALMVIAIASILMITSMSKFCYCDTTYKINNKNNNALQNIQASIEAQHENLQRRNNVHERKHGTSGNSVSHKENLLSYLTDNIERQHFKNSLKPVRAFVHQRPSKFDSGEDLSEEASDTSSSFSINRSRAFSNRSSTNRQHYLNIDKADEGLRQIMMMHEHALPPMTTSGQKQQQDGDAGLSKNSVANLAIKLREFSKGPARVASSLIKPNKMMSNVLSYLSPLVSAKLINSSSTSSKFNTFNPFVGRSNNQADYSPATKNLLTLSLSSSDYPSKQFSVTTLPQTSFLTKPNIEKANGRQFSPTQASISLNNLGDTVLKSALIKPNISPKDLLMSESSDQSSFSQSPTESSSSISTALAPNSMLNFESLRKQQNSQDIDSSNNLNSRNILKPLILSHSGSSWLRDNANKIAQSYIQDSFRCLLTLSQLPILQAGPISTAPSVLEKGSKSKDSNKHSGANPVTSTSMSNNVNERTRAIDELYRYAYILGTGVRRKRDPLTALGSSSVSKLTHSALTNNKKGGVFSQRSRNQFTTKTAASQTSNKQLLDYAKSLGSILAPGAKPRGVMWDMATDPSLAVTVFHLLERASVALPLGFLLMPFVKMIHNPLSGVNLANMLPSRATHRSVDYEELAKRLDVVDKMLSRALRPTHRESFMGK